MKSTIKISAVALLLALFGCMHYQYSYYSPSGDGIATSDLSGGTTSGPRQYLRIERQDATYFFSVIEHDATGKGKLGYVRMPRSSNDSPRELERLLRESLEIEVAGARYYVAEISMLSERPQRSEGEIRFGGINDFGPSFIMRFRRNDGGLDVVNFTRANADFRQIPAQLQ